MAQTSHSLRIKLALKPLNTEKPLTQRTALHYLWQGWRAVWQPGTRRYLYIPLIINALILILLMATGAHYFNLLTHWLDMHLPNWLHWLNALLWLFYYITALLISGYLFTWVSHLIAAPFYSLLSEHIQRKHHEKPCIESSWMDVLREFPRQVMRQLHLMLYILPRVIGILILMLIPGLNLIATALWFIFGAWMQAMQYVNYPMDNNRLSFSDLKNWLRQHRWHSLGFGGLITLLLMIPIINLFVLPAAVAGATFMWLEQPTSTN